MNLAHLQQEAARDIEGIAAAAELRCDVLDGLLVTSRAPTEAEVTTIETFVARTRRHVVQRRLLWSGGEFPAGPH